MRKLINLSIVTLAAIGLISGCVLSSPRTSPQPAEDSQAVETTEVPTSTMTPQPSATPTPKPTATPYQPIEGEVVLENMLLFQQPGYLFPVIKTFSIGETFSLLGRAPGNHWLLVNTTDGLEGWSMNVGVDLRGNLYDAPEMTPADTLVVHGRVFAPNGSPASLITVMINPQGAQDTKMQDVAISDITGRFYFFLPADSSGEWTLVANDWSCRSNDATGNCGLLGQFPPSQIFSLPDAANEELEIQILP